MSASAAPSPSTWSCACRTVHSDDDLSDLSCSRCSEPLVAAAPIALVVDTEPSATRQKGVPRAQQHGTLPAYVDLREILYRWTYSPTTGKRVERAAERGETYTRRLTGTEVEVAICLLDHLRPGTWIACRSQEGIALDLGIDKKTVRRALDVLYEAGVIVEVLRRPIRGTASFCEYRLAHQRLRVLQHRSERPHVQSLPLTRERTRVKATSTKATSTKTSPSPTPISLRRPTEEPPATCPRCYGSGWATDAEKRARRCEDCAPGRDSSGGIFPPADRGKYSPDTPTK